MRFELLELQHLIDPLGRRIRRARLQPRRTLAPRPVDAGRPEAQAVATLTCRRIHPPTHGRGDPLAPPGPPPPPSPPAQRAGPLRPCRAGGFPPHHGGEATRSPLRKWS